MKLFSGSFSVGGKVVDSNQEGRVSALFMLVQYTASLESAFSGLPSHASSLG